MEMLNIVWVLRGISAEKVRLAMQGYIDGRYKESGDSEAIELARKYKLDYSDKYRSQMMYILLGLYAQNKKYYSFNTFFLRFMRLNFNYRYSFRASSVIHL